jgi:hypothetical protein
MRGRDAALAGLRQLGTNSLTSRSESSPTIRHDQERSPRRPTCHPAGRKGTRSAGSTRWSKPGLAATADVDPVEPFRTFECRRGVAPLFAVEAGSALRGELQSNLERYWERIRGLHGSGLGPTAIYERVRIEYRDFGASIAVLKGLVARIQRKRGPSPDDIAIPVVTAAGEIAPVDFGYGGHHWAPAAGRLRKAWVLVMVLVHSGHQFARVVSLSGRRPGSRLTSSPIRPSVAFPTQWCPTTSKQP